MKRAQEKGLFQYFIHNICDWTVRNTRRVDDRPYGGWAGTIITIEPITRALRDIRAQYGDMPIYYMSPRGTLLNQEYAEEIVHTQERLCIICGHYEGIDERIFSLFNIQELSIGEYVLSSGELSALVFIDSMVRLIPWVIHEDSLREESFSRELGGKKEYPQYSRPEIFEELSVPKVLLSWDQKKIQQWKQENLRD
jgi:tRNA (guanine37-N1)-methyltransferase